MPALSLSKRAGNFLYFFRLPNTKYALNLHLQAKNIEEPLHATPHAQRSAFNLRRQIDRIQEKNSTMSPR